MGYSGPSGSINLGGTVPDNSAGNEKQVAAALMMASHADQQMSGVYPGNPAQNIACMLAKGTTCPRMMLMRQDQAGNSFCCGNPNSALNFRTSGGV
jgi:hypothetical protein